MAVVSQKVGMLIAAYIPAGSTNTELLLCTHIHTSSNTFVAPTHIEVVDGHATNIQDPGACIYKHVQWIPVSTLSVVLILVIDWPA